MRFIIVGVSLLLILAGQGRGQDVVAPREVTFRVEIFKEDPDTGKWKAYSRPTLTSLIGRPASFLIGDEVRLPDQSPSLDFPGFPKFDVRLNLAVTEIKDGKVCLQAEFRGHDAEHGKQGERIGRIEVKTVALGEETKLQTKAPSGEKYKIRVTVKVKESDDSDKFPIKAPPIK